MNDIALPPVAGSFISPVLMRRAQRILKGTATFADRFVPDHEELLQMAEILRAMGCAIGFTEGTWDLFHDGHGGYLEKGREAAVAACSDAEHLVFVVGVDSDALTKLRKGPTRPIEGQERRCKVLGYLRSIDIITVLEESEVFNRRLRPEVRIISESTGDAPDMDDMKKHCGNLVCLPPQAATGTTATIRKLVLEGGLETLNGIINDLDSMAERLKKKAEEMRNERGL